MRNFREYLLVQVFYIAFIVVPFFTRPSIVLFSYSAFGCKTVLINQFSSDLQCGWVPANIG